MGYVVGEFDADGGPAAGLGAVLDRLGDLAWLGIDAIVLPWVHPSPQSGSDAATDLVGVDKSLGGPPTLDALVAEAHQQGLRVVVSIAPNHTSVEHPWFRASRSSVDDAHRGFYHWREPGPLRRPPNNWVATTGGSAWTLDPATGQYFLHLFGPDRPDLNWNNPGVVRAFDEVLSAWLDRGVDGFWVGAAQGLVKNMLMPDNPVRFAVDDDMTPREVFVAHEHRYDLDQAGVLDVYRRWRRSIEPNGAVLIGDVELRDADPHRISRYVARRDGLHRAVYHAPRHVPWEPMALWNCFRDALDAAPLDLAWSASGPGHPPAVERFGGGVTGRERLLAYWVLLALLPGLPLVYQGDELAVDAGESWSGAVAAQRGVPGSPLLRQRDLLAVRRSVIGDAEGEVTWLSARTDPVLAFVRGRVIGAANAGEGPASFDLPPGRWTVRYRSSVGEVHEPASGRLELSAPEGVVVTPA